MGQSVQEFWGETRNQRARIYAMIESDASNEQPGDARDLGNGKYAGTCYIMSLRNLDRGTVAGDIVEAAINLAGQRIAEGTHRLATDDEIRKLKSKHVARGKEIESMELARNKYAVGMLGAARVAAQQAAEAPVQQATKK